MAGLSDAPYGAFEMKFFHQKHMLIGMFLAILFIAWAVGAAIHNCVATDETTSIDWHKWRTVGTVNIIDDISPADGGLPHPNISRSQSTNVVGFIPDPDLSDDVADEKPAIMSHGSFTDGLDYLGTGGGGEGGQFDNGGYGVGPGGGGDEIPPRGVFIRHEQPPVLVYEATPDYPKLALDGGFSAEVYLYAYVDKEGNVKKVEIIKCTRPKIGFEEAAEAAAYKNIYRPAIQNGYPIGVWIAYKMRFIAK
jgi:hypothetical protein